MDALIKTGEELIDYFFSFRKEPSKLKKGVFVTTKVRNEIIISEYQSKITLEGQTKLILFKNCKNGVYRAYLSD